MFALLSCPVRHLRTKHVLPKGFHRTATTGCSRPVRASRTSNERANCSMRRAHAATLVMTGIATTAKSPTCHRAPAAAHAYASSRGSIAVRRGRIVRRRHSSSSGSTPHDPPPTLLLGTHRNGGKDRHLIDRRGSSKSGHGRRRSQRRLSRLTRLLLLGSNAEWPAPCPPTGLSHDAAKRECAR